MNKQSVVRNFLLLFLLVAGNQLFADAIRLNGGQILDGRIVTESEHVVIIETRSGTFTIDKKDILETEKEGSKSKIARIPAEKLTWKKLALMSFIPGYSPLYKWDSHPEAGLPLAMMNFYYFYNFFKYQFGAARIGYPDSSGIGNDFISTMMLSSKLNTDFYAANPPGTAPPIDYFKSVFYVKWDMYKKHRDRKVGSEVMREDIYFHRRDVYLEGYITTSLLSFALSHYVFKKEGKLGSFFNTEHNGMRTAFYAFPVNDGARFGTITTF